MSKLGKNIKTQRAPNGTTYVYEDTSYWDKEKKQNRHWRNYIGKLGAQGEFIPNKKYLAQQTTGSEGAQPAPVLAKRRYWGATHLLDAIGEITGVRQDIEAAFPVLGRELLSLAYYLVLESDSPLYRFGRWAHDHSHPFGEAISSQRAAEILRDISESGKMTFFRRQVARRQDTEYLAYDTTSVSSYSKYIKAVRYGRNKDEENLPQVNLALVFGEDSGLPVYYRVLPGHIADVTLVKKLLKDVSFLEISQLKLVLDRGFYSADNINALFADHHQFLISVKTNVKFIKDILQEAKKTLKDFRNDDEAHDVYSYSVTTKWPSVETNPSKNAVPQEARLVYVHVYYNGTRAEEEKQRFAKSLAAVKAAVLSGKALSEAQRIFQTRKRAKALCP